MSSRSSKSEKCPPRAELSAFCDDCPAQESTAPHVAGCPECAGVVEAYRRIGRMIADSARELPDMDALNKRICAAIRVERARPPGFRQIFFSRLGKVAAVLMVGALTGVTGLHIGQRIWPGGDDAPESLAGPPSTGGGGKTAALPDLPYYTGLDFSLRNANSIPIQSLAAANYGDDAPVFAAVKGAARPLVYADIEPQVRQVWVMPETGFSASELQDFLRRQEIVNSSLERSSRGTLVLHAVLTKEQLVKLVRFLDSRRFDLLSPAAPQPEQKYFLGKPADMVGYTAEFVEN